MSHLPTLQRTIAENLELEAGVGQEYPEAEIDRGQVGQEFVFIRFRWRRLGRRRQEVMGELVREGRDQPFGLLQQRRNVADLDPVAGDREGAQRMLLRS